MYDFQIGVAKAGIFDFNEIKDTFFYNKDQSKENEEEKYKLYKKKFIKTNLNKNESVKKHYFEIEDWNVRTKNIVHCYSKYIDFNDWLKGIDCDIKHYKDYKINEMSFEDFLTKNILTDKSNANNNSFPHLPLEVHLMIKHENMGKIDGHRWFFKGICDMISPKFVQLIDCGSIPLQNSISHIIEYMNKHKNCGGACGEIECITSDQYGDYMGGCSKPKYWIERQTDNIVILTQYSEYKIAHYLDKAAESLFEFVSVLPGAFSTFRWKIINGNPLKTFLRGSNEDLDSYKNYKTCYEKNMYLAEDRIMCLEIVVKTENSYSNKNYYLKYIPNSKCLTDPPETLQGLINQRRRWYNGSLFASIHVLLNMWKICKRRNLF